MPRVTLYELLSLIVGGLGLVGGGIGFLRSRAAGREAEEASRAAREALARSASANEAAAEALQHANEIAESHAPRPHAHLSFEQDQGNHWIARNTGELVAYATKLTPATDDLEGLIRPDDDEPRDVGVGDGIGVLALAFAGSPPARVRVSYEERAGERIERFETIVLLPR